MVSAGAYLLAATYLVAVALCLGITAVRLRQRLLPTWQGASGPSCRDPNGHRHPRLARGGPWLRQPLLRRNPGGSLDHPHSRRALERFPHLRRAAPQRGTARASAASHCQGRRVRRGSWDRPLGFPWSGAITLGVIAIVFAHWGLTTKQALDRGIFNFDSLWYHMPFAVDMVQSHSVTGMHYTDTVFTNWFYPQNSELVHAVGILLTAATRSRFSSTSVGWQLPSSPLGASGAPTAAVTSPSIAAGILLECHTLVVREPGAAKNDLAAGALLLAAIAILVNAWAAAPGWRRARGGGGEGLPAGRLAAGRRRACGRPRRRDQGNRVGDGGGVDRRRGSPGAGWQARGRPGLVARPGPARRRLLVSAQPDLRRQPAAARSRTSGRSPCPIPSRLQSGAARLQHLSLRDRHRRLARVLLPGLHHAFGCSGRWSSGAHRRGCCSRCSFAAATGSCAGWVRWRCSGWSPTCSLRSAPPGRRGSGRLRDQRPLPRTGAAGRARAGAAGARLRRRAPPVGAAGRASRRPPGHRSLRRRPARSLRVFAWLLVVLARRGARRAALCPQRGGLRDARGRRRLRGPGVGRGRDRLPDPARLPARSLPQRRRRHQHPRREPRTPPTAGHAR